MNRKLICTTFLLIFAFGAFAQDSQPSFESTELAPGLYMLQGVNGFTGGNLGLSVGADGVVLIDDSLPPIADTMKAAIAKLSKDPVDFVINTHVHGDHTGGNEAMAAAGATIVAHDNIRKRMLEAEEKAAPGALPVLTFSENVTFHLNGQPALVQHVPHAHTDGDAIIVFKQANVIHTGDIFFNGMFPFIDLNSGGSVQGYINAQKRIIALADANTRIIPGHGPLASRADLQAAVDMLEDAHNKVAALVQAGKSEDEIVAANPLAGYHDKWNWQFISTERMTRTLVKGMGK